MYFPLMELLEVQTVERNQTGTSLGSRSVLKGITHMNSAQENAWHIVINVQSSSLRKLDLLKVIK